MRRKSVSWRRFVCDGRPGWSLLHPEHGKGCIITVRPCAKAGEGRFVLRCYWPGMADHWVWMGSVPKARSYAERWLYHYTDFFDHFTTNS